MILKGFSVTILKYCKYTVSSSEIAFRSNLVSRTYLKASRYNLFVPQKSLEVTKTLL